MTSTLKGLNHESAQCCELYLEESIKDQQRKILVIGKLCELIEDQATNDYNDFSYDTASNIKQLVSNLPPFTGVDSTSLTKKLDDLSKKMLLDHSDNMSIQAKSDMMSSRLNDSCQDAIEKFTTMANKGKVIKDAQMREWANSMLSAPREFEDIQDSASSIYSENFEFRFDGLRKQNSRDIDDIERESSVMGMIENFEKL